MIVVHTALRYNTRYTETTKDTITITPTHSGAGESLVTCNAGYRGCPSGDSILTKVVANESRNLPTLVRARSRCGITLLRVVKINTCVQHKDIIRRSARVGVDRKHVVGVPSIGFLYNSRQGTVVVLTVEDARHLGLETHFAKESIEFESLVEIGSTLIEAEGITLCKRVDSDIAVIAGIASMSRIDVDAEVRRLGIGSRTATLCRKHLGTTVTERLDGRSRAADRLLGEVELEQVKVTIQRVVDDTPRNGIHRGVHTELRRIGERLAYLAVHRGNDDGGSRILVAVGAVVHTHNIVVAIPYGCIQALSEIDNLTPVEVADSGTTHSVEQDILFVRRK